MDISNLPRDKITLTWVENWLVKLPQQTHDSWVTEEVSYVIEQHGGDSKKEWDCACIFGSEGKV